MVFAVPDEADGDSSNDKPFFSYGLFKPGQLGYFRIEEMVSDYRPATIEGNILTRDGIPILDDGYHGSVEGVILFFRDDESADNAYEKIAAVEPERQYE